MSRPLLLGCRNVSTTLLVLTSDQCFYCLGRKVMTYPFKRHENPKSYHQVNCGKEIAGLRARVDDFVRKSILRINETIQVLPEPHYISLKLESIHPVNLQKCRHWVASNPNCPAKGSIHFECAFTSRMFDAQLLQHLKDARDYVRAREQAFWSVVGFFQLTYQSIVGTCPSTAACLYIQTSLHTSRCLFKLQMILASQPHANLITKFLISSANFSSRPLEWGNFRVSLENKEMIRYRQLQGSLKGAMVECCESTWRKEPIVFPYLFKVHIERVARCSMTQRSELQMPETKNAEEVRDLLRGFLNSYFRIYLSEYFYAPPC
ncbi:hypothetical protein EGR_09333 [Echinococcus granulosus]|uniref:Uncharacterized protein n=1 Tax=Echinococcus granulosus TaxID=6210 RepID=W6UBJ2_ECHGR|nr:hypothetical protein EGR_09333 [Echinococcus granulosus]EUB55817.1 hypothetical protein EGR_09333 [Echinococcus granulosus]